MSEFLAVFKKEWREVMRTKKFYIFLGISLALVLFAFAVLALMHFLFKLPGMEVDEILMQTFKFTYKNATTVFVNFLASYFALLLIIYLRNYMSREIKEKKWILPLESGIKPQYLVIARILAITLTILISLISAFILHFVLCLIFCEPGATMEILPNGDFVLTDITKGKAIGEAFYSYGMILVYILFLTILILGINSATKKPALTVIIGLILIIVVDSVLASVTVKIAGTSVALQSFTPFVFTAQAITKATLPWVCWLSAGLTTAGIIVLMIFLSLCAIKIKGEKIK